MAELTSKLRIIPLGGVDEIGKNITVFEYGDDIVVVDCGSIFPKEDMLGIDLVIPDVTYLVRNRDRVRGLLLTHGHEDHIGAIPYVMRQIPMPLYGTRLTLALVENKLREHRISGIPMHVIKPRDAIQLGSFTVQFIKVSHSIAGAVAMAITTPGGTAIVTGDFKVDYTPIDGGIINLQLRHGPEHARRLGYARRAGAAVRFDQRRASGLHDVRAQDRRDVQFLLPRRGRAHHHRDVRLQHPPHPASGRPVRPLSQKDLFYRAQHGE